MITRIKFLLKLITLVLLVFVITKCSTGINAIQNPEWIDNLIIKFKNESVGNPPQSIWQYKYSGNTVYYIPAQCCDQYSTLYDVNGNILCAPDGGISGTGDGRCSDFFEKRTEEKLIWKDERHR